MDNLKNIEKNCPSPKSAPDKDPDTRDAVESAIDQVKEMGNSTWESLAHSSPKRVERWREGQGAFVRTKRG